MMKMVSRMTEIATFGVHARYSVALVVLLVLLSFSRHFNCVSKQLHGHPVHLGQDQERDGQLPHHRPHVCY